MNALKIKTITLALLAMFVLVTGCTDDEDAKDEGDANTNTDRDTNTDTDTDTDTNTDTNTDTDTDTNTDTNTDTDTDNLADQLVGTWIGFFEEEIDGPNGAPCDAIFFDLDSDGKIKILSFLGGDPAAGHKGTFSVSGTELTLDLTHDWAEKIENETILNWVEAPDETPVFAELSADGNSLTVGPSQDQAWSVQRIELSDLDAAFVGNWEDAENSQFQIDSASSFAYTEPEYSESGDVQQFTLGDDIYLFSNTTTSSAVGNEGNEGACDAYSVGRVALNADETEMTMWYGDYEWSFTRAE